MSLADHEARRRRAMLDLDGDFRALCVAVYLLGMAEAAAPSLVIL
jgi:hypothetical protein